ncbi:MAG TPA: rhodanese-like domain-containing protein [Nitrospirota bacterium]|nr:rhodanese-like domain-containing protein [Nitrospirota bacterium]
MLYKRTMIRVVPMLLAIGLIMPTGFAASEEAAPQQKPAIAKLCTNCHKAEPGNLRGNFDIVAYKSQSIQIKIDDITEVLKFDKNTLKTQNIQAPADSPDEPLRALKKGKEVRIEYFEKDGVKVATLLSAKPTIKVAPEKQISTAEVERLVAMGPDKGKYLLIDARPAPRFMEGAIPTAINIPFPAFEKMVDKLPKDKNALIVYYCAGMT